MDAAKEIRLKIVIDGKEAVGSIKLTKEELQNLKVSMASIKLDEPIKKTSKELGNLSKVSKRDLGIFANQMLYSSGITGRLQSQLSNIATGLMTGGMIGVGFAAGAAAINLLMENTRKFEEALDAALGKLIQFKDPLENIKFKVDSEDLDQMITNLKTTITAARESTRDFTGQQSIMTILYDLGFTKPDEVKAQEKILEYLEDKLIMLEAEKILADQLVKIDAERVDLAKKPVDYGKLTEQAGFIAGKAQLGLDTSGLEGIDFTKRVFDVQAVDDWTMALLRAKAQLDFITDAEQLQVDLTIAGATAWDAAGQAAAYAMGSQIKLFEQANSIAQIFLETLVQIAIQEAAMALFNFATGGLEGIVTNIFGAAEGAVVTRPTLMAVGEGGETEGVFPLSYLNNLIQMPATAGRIELFSRIEGDHIYLSNKRAAGRRNRNSL